MIWDLILGPLGAIIAAAVGIVGLWFTAQRSATVKAEDKRAAADAKAYQDKRREIDNADLGHGATDLERIQRLLDIEHRKGAGSDRR